MLRDAGDQVLEDRTGGIPCPRCGRLIVVLVGRLGPCEVCMRELRAEREARRQQLAVPHPCEACGREIVGRRRYCNPTCRKRAWRRRTGIAA